MACWCPCVSYNRITSRLAYLERYGTPHPDQGESCGKDCLLYYLMACFGVGCVLQVCSRITMLSLISRVYSFPPDHQQSGCPQTVQYPWYRLARLLHSGLVQLLRAYPVKQGNRTR